jgi:hypothetical protein
MKGCMIGHCWDTQGLLLLHIIFHLTFTINQNKKFSKGRGCRHMMKNDPIVVVVMGFSMTNDSPLDTMVPIQMAIEIDT